MRVIRMLPARVTALFLILNVGPSERHVDPDPELRVRHRRSRGRAMVWFEAVRLKVSGTRGSRIAKLSSANRSGLLQRKRQPRQGNLK